MITLEFLGRLRPIVPPDFDVIDKPRAVDTVLQLRDWLCTEVPGLAEELTAPNVKIVVNHDIICDFSRPVRDGDEIAFLPLMSGG